MWCYLKQPVSLYFYDIPHEFFRSKDKLMIDYSLRHFLEHQWARVYHHTMSVFECSIEPISAVSCCIIEKPFYNTLTYVCVVLILIDRKLRIFIVYLNSFTNFNQLFLNVSCSSHWSDLYEIFIAKLGGIIRLHPLIVNIQQGQVVTTWSEKVPFGVICMQSFFFWPVKYGISYSEHGNNRDYLVDTFVFLWLDDHLGKQWIHWKFCHPAA